MAEASAPTEPIPPSGMQRSSIGGDYESKTLFHMLGGAVAQWGIVEEQLLMLFVTAIEAKKFGATAAAFHKLETARPKTEATNAAMLQICVDGALAEWKKLHQRLTDAAKKRNHIAHYVHFSTNEPGVEERMQPSAFDSKYWTPAKTMPTYTKSQLRDLAYEFAGIARDLRLFSNSLWEQSKRGKQPTPPPEYPAQ